jgi:hypothetical protein
MTCIASLPDGTYLILNGAQQGVAGFGLATNPNLGAVLYDLMQPISRMSILNATVVACITQRRLSCLTDVAWFNTGETLSLSYYGSNLRY